MSSFLETVRRWIATVGKPSSPLIFRNVGLDSVCEHVVGLESFCEHGVDLYG